MGLEHELHVSGSSRLAGGKARVRFDSDTFDMIANTVDYRALLTPTAPCAGLAVTAKALDSFVVEELGGGRSDVSFDYLVILARPVPWPTASPRSCPQACPRCSSHTSLTSLGAEV